MRRYRRSLSWARAEGNPCLRLRGLGEWRKLDSALDLAHHRGERARDVRLELGPRALLDIGQHPLRLPRVAVRTLGAQRVVDVAHVHQIAGLVAAPVVVPR